MHNRIKYIPFYPFFLAVFPVLTLLGHNIKEVDARVAVRSIALSLLATLVVFLLARLLLRDWAKAAISTILIQVLFFTYGHLYNLVRDLPTVGILIARHRYFIPVYFVLTLAGIGWVWWKVKNSRHLTPALNLIMLLLLIFPIYQITNVALRTSVTSEKQASILSATEPLNNQNAEVMPDIYLIILDSHTRSDALQKDLGYDNSGFISELRDMGFYVADCSRSNYTGTSASLISELNMNYMEALGQQMAEQGLNPNEISVLLSQSIVRHQLESIGYKTVAFDSGYKLSRIPDAYAYLSYSSKPYAMQILQPFEEMLLKSTALLIWADSKYKVMPEYVSTPFHNALSAFEDHYNRQLFILDQLPELASLREPKFVFAHLIVPHIPYIFTPDGSVVNDPGFYSGRRSEPVDREHWEQGYINQVQFIESRILDVARRLIEQSDTPPIIIIQGDHGMEKENRLAILDAFYLPDGGSQEFYPTITPVNHFRILFNTYFGTRYEVLPDFSYDKDGVLSIETYPQCASEGQ
jgi:hypothetical protein